MDALSVECITDHASYGNSSLKYARHGDAGIDLRSAKNYVLNPFDRCLVECGVSFAIPDGYAGLVLPRSGLASNYGVTVLNSPGLIDSGYRGQIMVPLINLDKNNVFKINIGDRIAQLLIVSYPMIEFIEVDQLNDTERGLKGFGSTGI